MSTHYKVTNLSFSKEFSATVLTKESIPCNTELCTVPILYRPTHDTRKPNWFSYLWINNIGELVSVAMWLYYSTVLCQAVVRIERVLLFSWYNIVKNIRIEENSQMDTAGKTTPLATHCDWQGNMGLPVQRRKEN